MEELDEFVCTACGRRSETCRCEDIDFEYDFYEDYDGGFQVEPVDEVVCYLNGEPLYRSQVDEQYENNMN